MPADNIDTKSLLESLFPKPFIRTVLLESAHPYVAISTPGGGDHFGYSHPGAIMNWKMLNSNPHIDIVSAKAKAHAGSGPLAYQEIEGADSVKNYESKTSKTLVAKITYDIKEIIDENTLIGSWFSNQQFHKYIKVTLLKTENKKFTNALRYGIIPIKNSAGNYVIQGTWQTETMSNLVQQGHIKAIHTVALSELLGPLSNFASESGSEIYSDERSLIQRIKTINADGSSVYTFTHSVGDTIMPGGENPKHVAYHIMTHLDYELLAADHEGMPSDFEAMDIDNIIGWYNSSAVGSCTSEVVIDDFRIQNKATIFRNPTNGKIWTGPVSYMYVADNGNLLSVSETAPLIAELTKLEDQLGTTPALGNPLGLNSAGVSDVIDGLYDFIDRNVVYVRVAPESPNGVLELTKEEVINNKVQDFRSVERLNKLNIDLSLLSKVVSSMKFRSEKKSTIRRSFGYPDESLKDPGLPSGYLSEIDLAKDLGGSSRFLFAINFKNFVLENSKYAGLISEYDENKINTILAYSKIKKLKITRERVKDASVEHFKSVGRSPFMRQVGYEKFDKEQLPRVIVDYKNDSKNSSFQISPYNGAFGSIREVSLTSPSTKIIRHFTGKDKQMKNLNSGRYQYHLEMEVEDGAEQYIENVRDKLNSSINSLSVYRDRANIAIQDSMKKSVQGSAPIAASTEFMESRLPMEFIESERQNYPEEGQGPWCTAIDSFIQIIKTVSPGAETDPKGPLAFLGTYEMLAKQMHSLTSPETGNINSISSVVEAMINVRSRIDAVLDMRPPNPKQRSDFTVAGSMSNKPTNKIRRMSLKHYFYNVFEASENDAGYDFLTAPARGTTRSGRPKLKFSSNGLTVYPKEYYLHRIDAETLKYFTSTTNDLNYGPLSEQTNSEVPANLVDNTDASAMTFLSPARINLPMQKSIFRANRFKSVVDYNEIMCKVMIYNLGHAADTNSFSYSSENNSFQMGAINAISKLQKLSNLPVKTLMAASLLERNVYITGINNPIIERENMNPVEKNAGVVEERSNKTSVTRPAFRSDRKNTSQKREISLGSPLDDVNLNEQNDDYNIRLPFDPKQFMKTAAHELNSIDVYYLMSVLLGTTQLVPLGSNSIGIFNLDNPAARAKYMMISGPQGDGLAALPNQIKSIFQAYRSSFNVEAIKPLLYAPDHLLNIKGPGGDLVISIANQITKVADPYYELDRYAAYYMNYLNLVRVEVLTGYRTNENNEPMINQPIWKPLTGTLMEQKNKNTSLFCRLVKYDNPMINNFKKPEVLDLPIYDEFFIIENEQAVMPRTRFDILEDLTSDARTMMIAQDRANMRNSIEYATSSPVNSSRFARQAERFVNQSMPMTSTGPRSRSVSNPRGGRTMGISRPAGPTRRGGGYRGPGSGGGGRGGY